jgi:hypothetical protein
MTVRNFLDCSTANLTHQTCRDLWNGDLEVIEYTGPVSRWKAAAFVHVPCEEQEIRKGEIPEDLKGVLLYARRKGCDYVMFDRDADVITELPFYDW